MILGLFGDSVRHTSGLVSVIRAHGQFNTPNMKFSGDRSTKPEDTKLEMKKTSRNGIILIRNPFMVLFSYRNYIKYGLFLPSTNATLFYGEGNWCISLVLLTSRLIYPTPCQNILNNLTNMMV